MTSVHPQEIELCITGTNLKNYDRGSLSDTFAVVRLDGSEVKRTETIRDTLNPRFSPVKIDYRFEAEQLLEIDLYDRDTASDDLAAHQYIGSVTTSVARIMGTAGQALTLAVAKKGAAGEKRGQITLSCEPVRGCDDNVHIRFAASNLDRKDFFGGADPYIEVLRTQEIGEPTSAWRSETLLKTMNPEWDTTVIPVQQLCNADTYRPLILRVWDWDKSSEDDLIGECQTSLYDILSGRREFDLINPEKKAKKKSYKNSGTLRVASVEIERRPTFPEYLRGGLEMNLMVAIDYTASNGPVSNAVSLHHQHPTQPNQYQAAMQAVGSILLEYDSDKRVPMFGFGGAVDNAVSHCFPVSGDPSNPEVAGVAGMLDAYAASFSRVSLAGPTLFAPLIRNATEIAAAIPPGKKYLTLLILTDGVVCDKPATINAIVAASKLPISIIIVGVGEADFSAMEELDGDKAKLENSAGEGVQRDIVQFVSFSAASASPADVARQTLAELPNQVAQFMRSAGIMPGEPVQVAAPPVVPPPMPAVPAAAAEAQVVPLSAVQAAPAAPAQAPAPAQAAAEGAPPAPAQPPAFLFAGAGAGAGAGESGPAGGLPYPGL